MARRSKVLQLPQPLRESLDKRLVAGGFADYEGLTAWLAEQGYAISKSSLHRYGSKFDERLGALKIASEQARAVVAESPDDEGAMNEALVRLTQEKLFSVLLDLQLEPESIELPKLARAIADLSRSSVQLKRYRAGVESKSAKAAESVEKLAREGGLSKQAGAELRRQILGIAA